MRALPFFLSLALFLPQCGGGSSPEPKSAADKTSPGRSDDNSETPGDERAGPSGDDEKPNRPSCDDGTCTVCGSGICPSGWYCDEDVSGGAACSWLKECADKPSCSCVTRVLGASCKCREEGGGPKVSCS